MKNILDYLLEHNNKYEHDILGREFTLELAGDNIIITCNKKQWVINSHPMGLHVECEIYEILEDNGIDIRICEWCGTPMDEGFMIDDGTFYSCDECFESAMNEEYGNGNWRPSDEGEYGGYYEHLKNNTWEDTGIFWTQWY